MIITETGMETDPLQKSQLVLASASPRRAQLLDQIGIKYSVQVADINEDAHVNESPEHFVQRLAIEKAEAVGASSLPVLGADTLGVQDGELLIKPRDFEHARQMLRNMSGKWHQILSAVAISHEGKTNVMLNKNRVLFKNLSDDEIIAYWETGEPSDKAGAYAIQGLAATFIVRIEGSYSGIMGLPLYETKQLLNQAGVS